MEQKSKKALSQHEVNKRILAKHEVYHSPYEMINISGRYRDEDYNIYLKKRDQFFEAAKNYKMLNISTLNQNKTKLDIDGDMLIKYNFLELQVKLNHWIQIACELQTRDILQIVIFTIIFLMPQLCKYFSQEPVEISYISGVKLRKRTVRPMRGKLENWVEQPNVIEPWLRRYIILNKFIMIVRKLVLKKRLLDRLAILKSLDVATIAEHEKAGFFVINQSYPELFEKFLNPSM